VKNNETLSQYKWVDTHCHLQLMKGNNSESDLFNLHYVIIPGVDVNSSLKAEDMSANLSMDSYWSAGLHPHEADDLSECRTQLYELMERADLIGETGLDFYRNMSTRENQIENLLFHLNVAEELSKPIIIHCRDSFKDVYRVLEEGRYSMPVILHSWTGGNNWTKQFKELGVYFSISGIVTYKTAHDLQASVKQIPLDKLLLETDVPYLTPEPYKGQSNVPSNIMFTAQKLSELLELDLEELSKTTIRNTDALLGRTHE